jgi:hypothetical protein
MKKLLSIILSFISFCIFADNQQPLKLVNKSSNGYLISLNDNNIFLIKDCDMVKTERWSSAETIYSDPNPYATNGYNYKLYNNEKNELVDAIKFGNMATDNCTKTYIHSILKNPYGIKMTDDSVWWVNDNYGQMISLWKPLDDVLACKNRSKIINCAAKQVVDSSKIKSVKL